MKFDAVKFDAVKFDAVRSGAVGHGVVAGRSGTVHPGGAARSGDGVVGWTA